MKLHFLLLLITGVVFAKPLVKTNYDFYDIYPINKHKLEDSMDQTSPISNFWSIRHGTVY
jgi:predicted secreted Zn-dependent protease